MKTLLAIFLAAVCAVTGYAQTIKSLGYNTTNGQVIYSGTNTLNFYNSFTVETELTVSASGISGFGGTLSFEEGLFNASGGNADWALGGSGFTEAGPISFFNTTNAATTRTNLSLGLPALTNTNVTNFRTAIGLGATNAATFKTLATDAFATFSNYVEVYGPIWIGDAGTNDVFQFEVGAPDQAKARTNLGLGGSNIVTFAGLTNNGDITINQTATNNGLLFIRRTNNEPFLGLANLIASNNTTLSNETLFRVGVAEETNKAAQFGFRTVRTNNGGEGFAVFSVYGYNALMMIGPSDRSRTNFATNTNAAIEADIWTTSTTNRVATLRDTNSGAFTLHQELGFSTGGITTNAPANTTNVAMWLRVWIGTNNYRLPLYQ